MALQRVNTTNLDLGTLVADTAPAITSIAYPDGYSSVNVNTSESITIYGSNFQLGCTVRVGDQVAGVVEHISTSELRFETPFMAAGVYKLMVVNPDGQYAVELPGVLFTSDAVWTTPAGLLATINESLQSIQLVSTGVNYTLYDGQLPPGLTLSSTGLISGILSVTPVTNQTWYFTIASTDQYGSSVTRTFYIRFVSTPVVWITAGDYLDPCNEGYYLQGLLATSNSTITYTVVAGALPSGLTLSTSGIISGTVNSNVAALKANTTFTFTIRAMDVELQYADRQFTLTYTPTYPIWTSPPYVQAFNAGESLNLPFSAYSNSTVYYALTSGRVPLGTTLNASTGILSGTIQAEGVITNYNFTISAIDQEGHTTPISCILTINSAPMAATGGVVTTDRSFTLHTFTSGGTFTVTSSTPTSYASVLIVGGGGGGGGSSGGGGGAGGYVYIPAMVIPVGTYTITVGAGGAGAAVTNAGGPYGSDGVIKVGTQGSTSSAFGYTAYGGGAGASSTTGYGTPTAIAGLANGQGGTGGSGGGAGSTTTTTIGGLATQGYEGGVGASAAGGGGGGAGGAGSSGTTGEGGLGVTDPLGTGNLWLGGGRGGGTGGTLGLSNTTYGGGAGGRLPFGGSGWKNENITSGANGSAYGAGGGGGAAGNGSAYYWYNSGGGTGAGGVVIIKYFR